MLWGRRVGGRRVLEGYISNELQVSQEANGHVPGSWSADAARRAVRATVVEEDIDPGDWDLDGLVEGHAGRLPDDWDRTRGGGRTFV